MPTRIQAEEIETLRKALKMSEGEFADRIELKDREAVKLLESGALKPSPRMNRLMMKLLSSAAARSPRLKKMFESIKERSDTRW